MSGAVLSLRLGAAAGAGIGGGGLLVLYLAGFCGMDPYTAQGLNLCFYLCAIGGAFPMHAKNHSLSPLLLLCAALPGVPLSFLGAHLAGTLVPNTARIYLGGFLIIGGLLSFLPRKRKEKRT